jgi:hypothetical protein
VGRGRSAAPLSAGESTSSGTAGTGETTGAETARSVTGDDRPSGGVMLAACGKRSPNQDNSPALCRGLGHTLVTTGKTRLAPFGSVQTRGPAACCRPQARYSTASAEAGTLQESGSPEASLQEINTASEAGGGRRFMHSAPSGQGLIRRCMPPSRTGREEKSQPRNRLGTRPAYKTRTKARVRSTCG